MDQSSRRPVLESLERRAYAALTYNPSVAANDGPAATVVHAFRRQMPTLDEVSAYLDPDGATLRINGTWGDDSFRIRPISHGRVQVNTYTRESYTYLKKNSTTDTILRTLTLERTFVFDASKLHGAIINGGDGSDSVRATKVWFNAVPQSIESVAATPVDELTAPAGQTPSDPIHTGRYRPGSSWSRLETQERAVANASRANVAFFGDSLAYRFPQTYAWKARFPHAVALGIPGDTTRQMITRIQDGVFDRFKPKAVFVFAGTNNLNNPTTSGTDQQVYDGVMTVMSALRQKLPNAKLILIGLLPRLGIGLNDRIEALNTHVAATAEDNGFTFVDVYPRFVNGSQSMMLARIGTDSHYTGNGYGVLAYLLEDLLTKLTTTA